MTIAEKERDFIDIINSLDDWSFQYDMVLMKAMSLNPLAPTDYSDENLLKGCQAKVWIVVGGTKESVSIKADSKSLIVKGLLACVASIMDGASVNEIRNYNETFTKETSLGKELSIDRLGGIKAMVDFIKEKALLL